MTDITAKDCWNLRRLIMNKIDLIQRKHNECGDAIRRIVERKDHEYNGVVDKADTEIDLECERLGLKGYTKNDVIKLMRTSCRYKSSAEIKEIMEEITNLIYANNISIKNNIKKYDSDSEIKAIIKNTINRCFELLATEYEFYGHDDKDNCNYVASMWEEYKDANEEVGKGIHDYVIALQYPQLYKNDLDTLQEELERIGVTLTGIECHKGKLGKNRLCISVSYHPAIQAEIDK